MLVTVERDYFLAVHLRLSKLNIFEHGRMQEHFLNFIRVIIDGFFQSGLNTSSKDFFLPPLSRLFGANHGNFFVEVRSYQHANPNHLLLGEFEFVQHFFGLKTLGFHIHIRISVRKFSSGDAHAVDNTGAPHNNAS